MIDRGVEAKFVLQESAFLRAAGNADYPRASELRELADQRPDRSARRCDNHGFTGLGLADQVQTAISGEPWHTEHAETGRDRRNGWIKLAKAGAIRERVRAPSSWCEGRCRLPHKRDGLR